MEFAITVTVVVIVLSILGGYSLFKGGKEIENNNIKMAGFYWLLITTISIIMLLITYSNTMKLSGASTNSIKTNIKVQESVPMNVNERPLLPEPQ
jgi:Ca2+/H+ antiporter